MAPPTSEISLERRAAIIQGLVARQRAAVIASKVGVTRRWVYVVARELGLFLREEKLAQVRKDRASVAKLLSKGLRRREIAAKLGMTPGLVSKHLKIIRAPALSAEKKVAHKLIEVPQWVPAYMHEDYRLVAELDGEHAAAAWARGEKLGAA